jgi:hypothetical protein
MPTWPRWNGPKGPKANWDPTDLWTLVRIADVIEKTTGVKYHP